MSDEVCAAAAAAAYLALAAAYLALAALILSSCSAH